MEINFPMEYDWKESLLGDMAGRLKQVLKGRGYTEQAKGNIHMMRVNLAA